MIHSPDYWPHRDTIDRHRQLVAAPIDTRRHLLRRIIAVLRTGAAGQP